jgi:hypothetical protein
MNLFNSSLTLFGHLLQILYLDSLDTRDTKIPAGIPRVSAWSKKLVHKVLDMDMNYDGSFGKCLLRFCIPPYL